MTGKLSIVDCVTTEKGGVAALAEQLKISRPTLYRYMKNYDSGPEYPVPAEVRAIFDSMMADVNLLTRTKGRLERTLRIHQDRLPLIQEDYAALTAEYSAMLQQLDIGGDESKEQTKAILKRQLVDGERIIEHSKKIIEETRVKLDECTRQIELAQGGRVSSLQSKYYTSGNRIMVVHTGEASDNAVYTLDLYIEFMDTMIKLGSYAPAEGRSHFVIDDVVTSAPLAYEIKVKVKGDGNQDVVISTGMREMFTRGEAHLNF